MPGFVLLVVLTALLPAAASAAPAVRTTTHVYKQVGALEIKLDAHRLDDGAIRPLAVWIHGGALINGSREGIGRVGTDLVRAGYCVASIDYRLAPETKLPALFGDVEDAFTWLREHAREKLKADPSKIAVLGPSAGGYLTLTAGFRVKPRPTVLVSLWGYGEVVSSWYADPSPHERHRRRGTMTPEQMAAIEAGPPIADPKERVTGDGGQYYSTTRQLGVWALKVMGCDPLKERERFVPYMAAYNVTPEYPPTLLIHGNWDTDVPYEQSVIMEKELGKHGVPHRFITVPGAEHALAGGKPEDVEAAYASIVPFVDRYMR